MDRSIARGLVDTLTSLLVIGASATPFLILLYILIDTCSRQNSSAKTLMTFYLKNRTNAFVREGTNFEHEQQQTGGLETSNFDSSPATGNRLSTVEWRDSLEAEDFKTLGSRQTFQQST